MSSEREDLLQTGGFWMFGLLSVVLAILKLTVAPYWSWMRVLLPLLAFLGHNALYILVGLLCFCWLKNETGIGFRYAQNAPPYGLRWASLQPTPLSRREKRKTKKQFRLEGNRISVVFVNETF
jgi:hypothetical protein